MMHACMHAFILHDNQCVCGVPSLVAYHVHPCYIEWCALNTNRRPAGSLECSSCNLPSTCTCVKHPVRSTSSTSAAQGHWCWHHTYTGTSFVSRCQSGSWCCHTHNGTFVNTTTRCANGDSSHAKNMQTPSLHLTLSLFLPQRKNGAWPGKAVRHLHPTQVGTRHEAARPRHCVCAA